MAQSDTHRNELARLKVQEASLRKALNAREREAAKAREEARKKAEAAARATSPASRRSYLSAVERERSKALAIEGKAADVGRKLADNSKAQAERSRRLESAESAERKATEREDERRRKKELDHGREVARQAGQAERREERRRRKELEHSRDVARALRTEVTYVRVRAPEPERLRVLYLTSNPDGDLRTEAEVRSVQQALRRSKYRDQVEIHLRPAAGAQDLLDGLNDLRPHIVHYSGHGDRQGLAFDNGSVDRPEEQPMEFGLLGRALAATDTAPTLLVLNACDTLEGAAAILPTVPVIIAMSNSIPDLAAAVFAEQFYAGIASAQSVGASLAQARVKMELTLLDGAGELPQLVAREDVDVDGLTLIVPHDGR